MEFCKAFPLFGILCIVVVLTPAQGKGLREPFAAPNLSNSSVRMGSGCRVSVSINAFIPGRLGRTIPGESGRWFTIVPANAFNSKFPIFRGVFWHRGFGGGLNKMEVSFSEPVSRIGSLNSRILRFSRGRSIVRGKYNCLFRICTQTFTNSLGSVEKKIWSVTNPSRTESRITFKYAVENGASIAGLRPRDIVALVFRGVPGFAATDIDRVTRNVNPNIDMDVSVTLKKVTRGGVVTTTVDVRGRTDSFPDYEAFVNGRSIYQRKTTAFSALTGIRRLFTVRGLGANIGRRTRRLFCRTRLPPAPATRPPPAPATGVTTRPQPPTPVSQPTPPGCSSSPTIRIGSGPESLVRTLQTLLNRRGYRLVVDGIFGPLTDAAVRDWQRRNRLVVDGIVGPQTWGSLCRSIGQPASGAF